MNSFWRYVFLLVLFVLPPGGTAAGYAQISEKVFRSGYRIDSLKNGRLFVDIDNTSFFRNVESPNIIVPGYTLPGFRLQAKAVCQPVPGIRLEGGFHSLWFWGADGYPAFAYSSLAYWRGERSSNVVHVYPFFRAQVELSEQINIVFGNLYGAANHRLVTPLHNPELDLTADPETGLQVLYDTRWLHLDTWVNWETFIYKMDTKQEAFSFGVSALFKCNAPESTVHVSFPLQILAQHRGGQIDTTNLPVQTMLNGAAGVGMDWNLRRRTLKKIHLELNMLGYYQHAGNLWPLKRGYGTEASVAADLADFRIRAAYWKCNNFISMYGNPLFGAPSMSLPEAWFMHPTMYSLGGEYTRTFAAGYALGIDFDIHHRPSSRINDPSTGINPVPAKTCYSFGIYLRLNPSFLVKAFDD